MDFCPSVVLSMLVNCKNPNSNNISGSKVSKKKYIPVGVHVRRDDYVKYEVARNMSLIQPDYYINSVKKLKKKLGSKAVFLLITDDIPWCQENLLPKSKDLILVSDPSRPKKEGIGHDLAIMSLCQYSIISRGTFSLWASFFAKGKSITPYVPKYHSMFYQQN